MQTLPDLLLRAIGLILENGLTKTLTGQTYLQNALNSHIIDISVGTSSKPITAKPETRGFATSVVENVARVRKTNRRSHSFLSQTGHFRNRPENLL